jgi:membrane complex biogenesis BtpA family protein
VLAGARLTDQGIVEGEAHAVMRDRRLLGAGVLVFADVAVKHSAPLAERSLEDETEDLIVRARADALIVTGAATGKQTPLADLRAVKRAAGAAPVFAGSGVGAANVARILAVADGVIAGTALKRDGVTTNPVDPARVREFMRAARRARDGNPAPARSRPSPRGRSTVP